MNFFKWVNILFAFDQKQRKKLVEKVLEAIWIFKKGKPSPQGDKAVELLTSDKVELIGIVPDINYIRVASRDPDDLEPLWNHRFSVPTLLYRIKDSPFLLLANPNVEYNDCKLLEIDENSDLKELRDIAGIIG